MFLFTSKRHTVLSKSVLDMLDEPVGRATPRDLESGSTGERVCPCALYAGTEWERERERVYGSGYPLQPSRGHPPPARQELQAHI